MMLTLCLLLLPFLSLQKYRITKRVGGGSFGDIYLGVGANGEKVRRTWWPRKEKKRECGFGIG